MNVKASGTSEQEIAQVVALYQSIGRRDRKRVLSLLMKTAASGRGPQMCADERTPATLTEGQLKNLRERLVCCGFSFSRALEVYKLERDADTPLYQIFEPVCDSERAAKMQANKIMRNQFLEV